MFDVRKLKPIHGWREFVGEVGIIVLGVTIALSAEQAVEALHWRDKVTEAHDALKVELTEIYQSSAERIAVTPCLNTQLDILKSRVLTSKSQLNPAPIFQIAPGTTVYRHPSRLWDDAIWQGTLSEQVSSHFGHATRQNFAFTYNEVSALRRLNAEETSADGPLNALGSPLPLDPSLRGHLIELIEAERQRVYIMDVVAKLFMKDAHSLMPDLSAALHDPEWNRDMNGASSTMTYCLSKNLPLATIPRA